MEKINDRDLKRNGSGCLDLTAYEAIKKVDATPEPEERTKHAGELWSLKNGKTVLILAPFDDHSLALALLDVPTNKPHEVAISYNGIRWTSTSMIQYVFDDYLQSFRKKVTSSEMAEVRELVAKSLAPALPVVNPHEETDEMKTLRIERDYYKNLCELAMKGKEGVSCKE